MKKLSPLVKDRVGQKYGMLTVQSFSHRGNHYTIYWKCLCDCGNTVIVAAGHLNNGHTKSCGCNRWKKKHGCCNEPWYGCWKSMMERCYLPKTFGYYRYGKRGITVCERWKTPVNFGKDMGVCPPSMTLDRIDNDGNYEPNNCRWTTMKQQSRNRVSNRFIEIGRDKITIAELAERFGIPYEVVYGRINGGWELHRVLSERVMYGKHKGKHPIGILWGY